jgi:hypothetical protein
MIFATLRAARRSVHALAAALAGATLVLLPAPAAKAQLHATDIIVQAQGGRLTTAGVTPSGDVAPQRVFVGTLSTQGATSNPGFDSNPAALPVGTGLPPNTQVAFEFAGSVRLFNVVDFSSASPRLIRVRFGPLIAFSPAADAPAPGFAVSADDSGIFHNHYTYATFLPGTPPVQSVADGLYLLTLRLSAPAQGLTASEPFYLILNRNADAQLPAAIAAANALVQPPATCTEDYNRDGFRNLDDLGDFITDFYTAPPIPAGAQPDAPTYSNQAVGFGTPCPNAPDAPAPYAPDAYRLRGYRVGFSPDASNACPLSPEQTFPNLDNLGDYLTAYYASAC